MVMYGHLKLFVFVCQYVVGNEAGNEWILSLIGHINTINLPTNQTQTLIDHHTCTATINICVACL